MRSLLPVRLGGWLAMLFLLPMSLACRLLLPDGWDRVHFDANAPAELEGIVITDSTGTEGVNVVRASVNDRTGWFVLDTGGQLAVLDDDFADALELSRGVSVGLGCDVRGVFRRADSFRLGPMRCDDPVFLSVDLEPLLTEIETEIDLAGIVGAPIFEQGVFEFDYGEDADRVRLHPPGGFELPRGRWQVLKRLQHGAGLPARLDGREGLFFLDTGKSGTISVSTHFEARHRLLEDRERSLVDNRRLCGISEEWEVTLDHIEMAGRRFESPVARFRIAGTEAARNEDPDVDGVIGRELLRAFHVVFDYPSERLVLIPR